MKKAIAVLVVLAFILAVWLHVSKEITQLNATAPQTRSATNGQTPQPVPPFHQAEGRGEGKGDTTDENQITPTDASSRAASPDSSASTNDGTQTLAPLTVLDNARVAIHNYCGTFGENPVGNNAEITAALMGKNPKGINFIRAGSGLNVNGNGEMVDAYGTPFFFHQLSGTVMEIRSAGEDRTMWTPDDQVKR